MALADDMNNVSYEELQEIVLKIDGIDLNDLCFLEKTVPVIQAIQPKNYNEFKRSVALAMGVGTWVDSGEVVFKDEKTDVNGLIAFKSDILTHLKSHHVEDGIANEIANKIAAGFIAKGKCFEWHNEWCMSLLDSGIEEWYIWLCQHIESFIDEELAEKYSKKLINMLSN